MVRICFDCGNKGAKLHCVSCLKPICRMCAQSVRCHNCCANRNGVKEIKSYFADKLKKPLMVIAL